MVGIACGLWWSVVFLTLLFKMVVDCGAEDPVRRVQLDPNSHPGTAFDDSARQKDPIPGQAKYARS